MGPTSVFFAIFSIKKIESPKQKWWVQDSSTGELQLSQTYKCTCVCNYLRPTNVHVFVTISDLQMYMCMFILEILLNLFSSLIYMYNVHVDEYWSIMDFLWGQYVIYGPVRIILTSDFVLGQYNPNRFIYSILTE